MKAREGGQSPGAWEEASAAIVWQSVGLPVVLLSTCWASPGQSISVQGIECPLGELSLGYII